ncbi:MAG: NAD(P)/FAD-dependent oxidoreductase [Rickettsiales bacterium]
MESAPEPVQSAPAETIYIVGGGIAGMCMAQRLVAHAKAAGNLIPAITIIDREPEVAQGSSKAYGGFISANSYETVNFSSGDEARKKLTTPYAQGGWAIRPNPTRAEQRFIDEVARQADLPDDEKAQARTLYHQFGYGCIDLWRQLMAENPHLAQACGFHYETGEQGGGILKIVTHDSGKALGINDDIAFLHATGGDGVHTRHANATEAREYFGSPPPTGQYVRQHGGQMNGRIFCRELAKQLRADGCDLKFMGQQEVVGIDYAHNVNRINGLQLRNTSTGAKKVVGDFTDRYVFATGPARPLWNDLGFTSPPVMGVCGTSITLPVPDALHQPLPTGPVKFVDRHGGPVLIPLKDEKGKQQLRVGGYTLFSGDQRPEIYQPCARHLLARQLALLQSTYPKLAENFVAMNLAGEQHNIAEYCGSWVGERPVTPDNHAIVGQLTRAQKAGESASPVLNGYLLTGLGAAGLLGMGAADILAQQMESPGPVQVPGITEPKQAETLLSMVSPERLAAFRAPLKAETRNRS